jgi:hypothetical protein
VFTFGELTVILLKVAAVERTLAPREQRPLLALDGTVDPIVVQQHRAALDGFNQRLLERQEHRATSQVRTTGPQEKPRPFTYGDGKGQIGGFDKMLINDVTTELAAQAAAAAAKAAAEAAEAAAAEERKMQAALAQSPSNPRKGRSSGVVSTQGAKKARTDEVSAPGAPLAEDRVGGAACSFAVVFSS